jgi:hypothetical protein
MHTLLDNTQNAFVTCKTTGSITVIYDPNEKWVLFCLNFEALNWRGEKVNK